MKKHNYAAITARGGVVFVYGVKPEVCGNPFGVGWADNMLEHGCLDAPNSLPTGCLKESQNSMGEPGVYVDVAPR